MSTLLGLNEVADFIMGQAPHSSTYNESGEGELLIKAGDFGQLYPEPATYTTSPIAFSCLGDVIICVVGATSGKVNLGIDASITRSVAALRPKSVTDTKYLYYLLKGSYQKLNRAATGSAQGILNKTSLSNFKIPLPPLEEQKKIAAILDAADDYRQKTKALIDKYDQLTQSLFLDMFGDPVTNPMGWNKEKLLELTTKVGRGKGPKYSELETGFWAINQKCIQWGTLFNEHKKYVDETYFNSLKPEFKATHLDLLINSTGTGTLGRSTVYSESTLDMVDSHVTIVRPIKNIINSTFLQFLINHPNVQSEIYRTCVTGSTNQIELNRTSLSKFLTTVPHINLQNQFAERVVQIENQKQQAEASLVKAEELFNSLLQKAFKGDLTN